MAGLFAALLVAGCGGASGKHRSPTAFAWLHPGAPPVDWQRATDQTGVQLAFPADWTRIASDRGTATAALFAGNHQFAGYLNLTPRQSGEAISSWPRFRVEHNADEHDRSVSTLAAQTGLHFRSGTGSCVRDSYVTTSGSRYIELACLIMRRSGAGDVIVAAAPPASWARLAPTLERAISAVG